MEKTFTAHAKMKFEKIRCLSDKYNGKRKEHAERIMELIEKHVYEIRELRAEKDPHFSVETGDLLVLCVELIMDSGRDPDEIMDECYGRYINKLEALLLLEGK